MYLLDTHAFLWFLNDDAKLPPIIKELIMRAECLYISIGSFWEMAIKAKLKLPSSISILMNACEEMNIAILPITGQHLECLQNMPDFHGDPFDRLIISQGMVEDLTILSADSKFDRYGARVLWQ